MEARGGEGGCRFMQTWRCRRLSTGWTWLLPPARLLPPAPPPLLPARLPFSFPPSVGDSSLPWRVPREPRAPARLLRNTGLEVSTVISSLKVLARSMRSSPIIVCSTWYTPEGGRFQYLPCMQLNKWGQLTHVRYRAAVPERMRHQANRRVRRIEND